MGKREERRPPKPSKTASPIQEIPPSYPNWSSSMQAYYGAMPPSFFAPFVASPTPHPYLWGSQHPLIPPFGTSVPYPALYYPGSLHKVEESAKQKFASYPFFSSPLLNSAESGTKGTSNARDENIERRVHHININRANARSNTARGIAGASVPAKPVSMPATDCPLPPFVPQIEENETACDLEAEDKRDSDKDDNDVEENENVEEPKCRMTFSSEQEFCIYYKQYAKQVGFGMIHQRSKKEPGGCVTYLTLAWARFGKARNRTSNVSKSRPTMKIECKAKINAMLVDGSWRVTTVELAHNHALSPHNSRFFRCNRKLDPIVKRKFELNDRAKIRTSKKFNSLVEAGGFAEARHLQLAKEGAEALRDYFDRMQETNDGFYAVMDLDDEFRLRNVFWADARSRAAYEYFGDVVTFDTTYLTNQYRMLFAHFVGVNHHGQSILLGAGLISGEDADTFVWLFQTWLKCINGRAPSAIITDQDMTMKSAIAIVFPRTRQRYCVWHILRKLPEKLGSHAQYTCGLKRAIQNCLYDCQSCDEFENSWERLLDTYNLHDNAWLRGLYTERTYWAPTHVKDAFWAGMSTKQRSESMSAFFDGSVHSGITLKEFVDQFKNVLRRKVENENAADFNSFNCTIPYTSHFHIEKKFQEVYTNAKFREVQQKFMGMIYCHCSLIKTEGAISTYQVSDELNVDDYIKEVMFCVYFNENECEVKCTCGLFEIRGI